MRNVKLRGQMWRVDDRRRELHIQINRLQKDMFSLSDRAMSYVRAGWTAIVTIKKTGGRVRVDRVTPVVFDEMVPSKYRGMAPWKRYWFRCEDSADLRGFPISMGAPEEEDPGPEQLKLGIF